MIVKREGTSLPPLKETTYSAICSGVVDLGTQYSERYKKQAHKLLIFWELPDTDEGNGPRVLSKEFTALLDDKATLRKWLEIWRSKPFTPEELEGFDLENVVGAGCYVSIQNQERDGRTYSNIAAIVALPRGTRLGQAKKQIRFDMGVTPQSQAAAFKDMGHLPEWVQNKIKKSAEYAAYSQGTAGDTPDFMPMADDELPF